jgi:hypothetical protein
MIGHHRIRINMLAPARRPTASLCIALLALNAIGCHQINQREADPVLQSSASADTLKKVVGVTLKDGREIRFDAKSRAFVSGDTLQAQVEKQAVGIPVSDVQRLWVDSLNTTKTSWLVLGILVAAYFAVGALAASQMSYDLP